MISIKKQDTGKASERKKQLYAVIRLRGRVNVNPDVKHTLRLLRLHRKYNLAVYPKNLPGLEGMLRTAKDWITWGEIDESTLKLLLEHRGIIIGGHKLTDKAVLEEQGLKNIDELVEKIFTGDVVLHKNNKIKPVFRLHPPKRGFEKTIRKPYKNMGELGYRGASINALIRKMI